MKTLALIAILFASLSSLTACTSNQSVQLAADGSGTASFRLEVKKLFADFIAEDKASGGRLFNVMKIKQAVERRPGITVQTIAAPTKESIALDFTFKDIRKLFTDRGDDGIISLSEKNGQSEFAFHLDRNNAKYVAKIFSEASNPAFGEMRPRKQRASTEKEYLEAISFMVGNEGPELVKSSIVEFRLEVGGTIISVNGGNVENGAAVFRLPLLKLLLLEKPLDYSVTFAKARKTGQKQSPKSK